MIKTAEISSCERYRYQLGRIWNEDLPVCLWIMLNPSTADARKDDQTIKRCIDYSKRWGYGGLMVGNLFAWRTTYPDELRQAKDPVGPENDQHLDTMLAEADFVICAWGIKSPYRARASEVLGMLNGRGHALAITKDGHPGHPSRLSKDLRPIPYR